MPDDFNPTEWITTGEAAELARYSPFHIRQLIQRGKIAGKKHGRDWLVCRDSVQAYVDEMKMLGLAKLKPMRDGFMEGLDLGCVC